MVAGPTGTAAGAAAPPADDELVIIDDATEPEISVISTNPVTDRVAAAPTRHLYPVPAADGPHGRLGVLWFALVMATAALGDGWVALTFAVTAGLAAAPFDPARSATAERPSPLAPGFVPAAAAALPLAALAGARGLAIALFMVVATALAGRLLFPARGPAALETAATGVLVAVAIGLAAASPVLAARLGTGVVIGLLLMASAYDAGTYLVGVGAGHGWEGPVAGVTAVAVVGFSLALVNAFGVGGETTWLVTAAAAVLLPLGPPLATALAGDSRRRLPVLRRLDVLLVAGPLWVWIVAGLR